MDMDDESDDSSSALSPPETLEQFREKWQQELTANKPSSQKKNNVNPIRNACEPSDNSNDQVNNVHFSCVKFNWSSHEWQQMHFLFASLRL